MTQPADEKPSWWKEEFHSKSALKERKRLRREFKLNRPLRAMPFRIWALTHKAEIDKAKAELAAIKAKNKKVH